MHRIAAGSLLMLLVVIGVQDVAAQVANNLPGFPSAFLQHDSLLELMKTHFDVSINQLLTSKQYGSQYLERPGLAKLLKEESDRHWEEGMETLKEYLQIGGIVDTTFLNKYNFGGKGELKLDGTEQYKMKYLETLMELMSTSRGLVTQLTNDYHLAIQREHPSTSAFGDAEVARFLLDQVEEESKMAHKMAAHSVTYNSIKNIGVAQEMFDEHL